MSIAERMSTGMMGAAPAKPKMPGTPHEEHDGGKAGLHEHHEEGGKHMHVHKDEMGGYHSSQHDGEKTEGPHDHENLEALKSHMGKFFDEEEHEGEGEGYGGKPEGHKSMFDE